jgi:hypothetical protein
MNIELINFNILINFGILPILITFVTYKILHITSRKYFPQQRICEGKIKILYCIYYNIFINF